MENTKKQQIIDLFLLGYSKGIISEMVDTSEGYVGKIVSIYLKEKGIEKCKMTLVFCKNDTQFIHDRQVKTCG